MDGTTYLDAVAFERLLLDRVVPVIPRQMGEASGTYHIDEDRMEFRIAVNDTVGMTLDTAVDRLGIVPLAVGAAWKVVDVLMEFALEAEGERPGNGKRWTIAEKIKHASSLRGDAEVLSSNTDVWARICGVYGGLEDVRHSIVHRRTELADSGDLTGVDSKGSQIRSMSRDEQMAFCRVVTLALDALGSRTLGGRSLNEVLYHLDLLARWHGLPVTGAYEKTYPVSLIEVEIPEPWVLDLRHLKTKLSDKLGSHETDLLVELDSGRRFLIELESAEEVELDLSDAPALTGLPWLRTL